MAFCMLGIVLKVSGLLPPPNRLLRFGVWQPLSSLRGVGMAFCVLGIVLKVSGLLPAIVC